eukprot:gene1190-1528_t
MNTSLVFEEDNEDEDYEQLYEKMGYPTIKREFEKTHFKVKSPICYCEVKYNGSLEIRKSADMSEVYKNMYCIVRIKDKKNGVPQYIKEKFIHCWYDDPDILTYEDMNTYPPPLVCPPQTYNMWQGFAIQNSYAPSSNNIQPFIEHLKVMVGDDEKGLDHFVKWLAQAFQQPGKLTGTSPVLRGEQGTGKNVLFDILIKNLVGDVRYYQTCNPSQHLFDRFSVGRVNKVFVCVDETKGKESCANSEIMKNAITSPSFNFEKKGVDPFTLNNFNRFIFLSNNNNPVKIEQGDRRYFMFDTRSDKIGDKAYFDAFIEYAENECNQKAIYNHLMSIDISKVNWITERPKTDAYEQLQTLYVDVVYQFLINLTHVVGKDVHEERSEPFYQAFRTWCKNNGKFKVDATGEKATPLTNTMFGISMGRLVKDAASGVSKRKSDGRVLYTFNITALRTFFDKRGLLGLDFDFKQEPFLSMCGYNMQDDEYDG